MTLNRAASRNGIQAQSQADVFGVVCSVGCAIHCAATPILLSALPSISSLQWLADPLFHRVVAVVCAVLVVRAILPGWRLHRSRSVALFAISGISLLFAAAFILPDRCCDQHPDSSARLRQSADSVGPLSNILQGSLQGPVAAPQIAVRLVSHPSVKESARQLSTESPHDCGHSHGAVTGTAQSRATHSCKIFTPTPAFHTRYTTQCNYIRHFDRFLH